jgi:hypothetical protein
MLSGEPATITDNKKIVWCVAPGDVRTLATVEDMTTAISEAEQPIIADLTAGANAVANVVEGVLDGVNHVIDDNNGKYYMIGSTNGSLYLEETAPDPTPPVSETILTDIDNLNNNKQDKANIIQSDAINDSTKYPSAAVTYGLGQEIDNLNDILTRLFNLNQASYVTNFNDGENSDVPGRWHVYNESGTDANAPYSGLTSGYVDVVVMDTLVYQTFYDFYGDVYFKKWTQGSDYGTWKKLTN